ncbi:siderophore ABC transporter substrate-binding protein [Mesorhizobium sp. J18]|uniref:siderophore ABC transporter substrate-binding protein n=1 Tax=Mesorhizobium sp. J18 TaxID=935263 RepID=UPI001FEDE7C9|nr:siderophore ABC transporter substrate-binding protein [Mesorhizobium sp. J18]
MIFLTALALAVAAAVIPTRAQDLTIKHAQGETTVSANPETVLVFDLASLDTLDALGVEVDGVPGGAKPEYLAKYSDGATAEIGTLFEPDYEAVSTLEPDLIIVGGRSAAKYAEIAKLAPTIDLSVDQTDYLNSMRSNVETLARIFGKETEAKEKLASLSADIEKLKEAAKDAGRVLVVLTTGGRMSAHGPGGRFGIIYGAFGFTPAAEGLKTGTHGQAISNEFILENNPDWLFVLDRDAAIGREGQSAQQLLDNDLVRQTTAWQKQQVVYLNAPNWYLVGGGLTAMQMNARQIAEALSGNN